MVAFLSTISLLGGAVTSCCAERLPVRKETAELLGGLLLVSGLSLIGFGLSRL